MKRFFILMILSAFFSSANIFSQDLEFFTAKDGYATALSEVSAFLDSPQLMFVGTQNSNDPEAQVSMEYKTSTGEANGWLYIFRETEYPEIYSAVYVVKAFIYFGMVIDQSDFEGEIPGFADSLFTDNLWIDSDDANTEFLKCDDYATYTTAFPTPTFLQVAMYYNDMDGTLPNAIPIWSAMINLDDTQIYAGTNCYTKELYCNTISSVKNTLNNLNNISIKQYGNNIKVSATNTVKGDIELSVYSIDGTVLLSNTYPNNGNDIDVYFPFDSFASGSFFISARSKNGFAVQPVIIAK